MKISTSGFSLIEAVVTAVIMVILATVAIPLYVGYIRDQRQQTVNNLAETAAAAANAYFRRTGTNPNNSTIDVLQLYYDNSKYSITIPNNGNIRVNELNSSFNATRTY
jgi:type II secretory pathway pseudopilin PulG